MLYLERQVGGASVFVIVFTPAESTRNIENICIQCNPTALHLTWSLWGKSAMFCMNLRLNPSASQRLTEKYSILQYLHFMIIFEAVVHLSLCSGLQCSCPRYCVCHLYVPTVCRVTWIYIQCIIVCLCRVHSTAYKHKQTQGLNAAARKIIVHLQMRHNTLLY